MYPIIAALFKHSHKNGTKKFLLCNTHVEWYDHLGKTLATLNYHFVLNLLQAAKGKSLKSEIFRILGVNLLENRKRNRTKSSLVWKFKLFIIFKRSQSFTKKKKLCDRLKIIKSLNFQLKFLLPRLKKKKKGKSVVNGGWPPSLSHTNLN